MSKQKNRPNLRFPEFANSAEWEAKTLEEVAEVIAGQSPSGESYNEVKIGKPFYQGKTDFGEIYLNNPTKWTTEPTKIANEGDILFSVRAPVGALNISNDEVCIGRGLAAIQAKQEKWFLYYFLNSIQSKIIGNGGSVFDSINKDQIEKIKISIPNLKEQHRIASCLSSLDEVIAAHSRQLELLKNHKKGLMQNLFPAQGTKTPNKRFKEFKGEWELKPLGEEIELLSGYPFGSSEISENPNGIPIMRGINITEGFVRHNKEIDRFFLGNVEELRKYKLKIDDLVIGMDGSKVGKNSALITQKDANSILIQRVARLRAKKSSSIQFIFQQINSTTFHSYVDKINTSGGIPHISAKQINEFEIYFPSLLEQQKIASCLSSVDELITAQAEKIAQLKAHKKGLMQNLFPTITA